MATLVGRGQPTFQASKPEGAPLVQPEWLSSVSGAAFMRTLQNGDRLQGVLLSTLLGNSAWLPPEPASCRFCMSPAYPERRGSPLDRSRYKWNPCGLFLDQDSLPSAAPRGLFADHTFFWLLGKLDIVQTLQATDQPGLQCHVDAVLILEISCATSAHFRVLWRGKKDPLEIDCGAGAEPLPQTCQVANAAVLP